MVSGLISLPKDYWETFEVNPKDIEYINSYLFELEIPLTSIELTKALINERINFEKEQLKMQQQELGKVYLPKEQYQVGDTLIFPALNWQQGSVTSIRPGVNPEMEAFEVITIEMARGVHREFASKLADHSLNQPLDLKIDDEQLVLESVLEKYGAKIQQQVTEALIADPDLVSIGGRWFPSALLVDVNIGHLNLAEAVLDMANGGPLATKVLLEQIDLPSDVNPKLRELLGSMKSVRQGRFYGFYAALSQSQSSRFHPNCNLIKWGTTILR
jgi:hypothetical protein